MADGSVTVEKLEVADHLTKVRALLGATPPEVNANDLVILLAMAQAMMERVEMLQEAVDVFADDDEDRTKLN